jgi:hypothetical protein
VLADYHNNLNMWKNYWTTAELLVSGPSCFEVEFAVTNQKNYKLPASDKIPAELIQVGGEILMSAIHNLINSIWNMEELPDQWKESIITSIHKKGDKTDCNNHRRISMLSTLYQILSNIFLSRLSPYTDEIIRDHQCWIRRNRSTTGQFFCIPEMLERKGSSTREYISYS